MNSLNIFNELESEVRSYCRSFPTVFTHASGYRLRDDKNKEYIDFFSGAGALNYGHNPSQIKKKLIAVLKTGYMPLSRDTYDFITFSYL